MDSHVPLLTPEEEAQEEIAQATRLGMALDRVVQEARAMGLDVQAVVAAYAKAYVAHKVRLMLGH